MTEAAVAVDHWQFMADFCRWERAVGGPDPHMGLVGHLSKGEGLEERIWRCGLYIGAYNVPTAEVLWREWPYERARQDPDGLEAWVRENWKGLTFRRERRAVRTPDKFARYLLSYLGWAEGLPERPWFSSRDYEAAWNDIQRVYGLGRYVAIKGLEFLHRYCGAETYATDIRAKGGWSPRRALCLLYPERTIQLDGNDSPENVRAAEWAAETARDRLATEYGVDLDWYNLQVLLCDYKQCYVGRRQFPGRSQDSEIEYDAKIRPYWGGRSDMWAARSEIFPHVALGELQGWRGVREELGDVLADSGYIWSDLLYDYLLTSDLSSPVER